MHQLSVPDIGAHIQPVQAGLDYIAGFVTGEAAVVIGGQLLRGQMQAESLGLPRLQQTGFGEAHQLPGGIAQHAAGFFHKQHHGVLSGVAAGVGDGDPVMQGILRNGFRLEGGIGQAVAKGIENPVPGEGFQPAVTQIDVLAVLAALFLAEVRGGGIVLIAQCNGICQTAGGDRLSQQQVGGSIAAFHASMPENQHGAEGVVLQEGQIHDGADVQQQHGVGKPPGHQPEHIHFLIGEVVAPFFRKAIPILPGAAADDDQGIRGKGAGLLHHGIRQMHLRMGAGPLTPGAGFGRILHAEALIGLSQDFVDLQLLTAAKGVQKVYLIGGVHIAGGAVAGEKPVDLGASEYRQPGAGGKGKDAVFQQNCTLGGNFPKKLGHTGGDGFFRIVPGIVLRQILNGCDTQIFGLFHKLHGETS